MKLQRVRDHRAVGFALIDMENLFDFELDIIAERILLAADDPTWQVRIRLGKPSLSEKAQDYKCAYQVLSPGREIIRFAFGIDAFQALELALRMIGAEIESLQQEHGLTLMVDDTDLG